MLEHDGKKAVFTGDTLFIGDCVRPDLTPDAGDAKEAAVKLAKDMYHSHRNKLLSLPGEVTVYPAHGAGTLCGKALSNSNNSTIEDEIKNNWSLQPQTEDEFVKELLSDQPFVPVYFSYDVDFNKHGAIAFEAGIKSIPIGKEMNYENEVHLLNSYVWVVDSRNKKDYKAGHLPHSVNIMKGLKFDTWLGSIIKPEDKIYFAASDSENFT